MRTLGDAPHGRRWRSRGATRETGPRLLEAGPQVKEITDKAASEGRGPDAEETRRLDMLMAKMDVAAEQIGQKNGDGDYLRK